MKKLLCFTLAVALLAIRTLAADTAYQMPAQKCGTGFSDYYNVGVQVGDSAPDYWVCVATKKKYDLGSITAKLEGAGELRVGDTGVKKAFFQKADVVVLHLTREQAENASDTGATVVITSKLGDYRFDIPAAQFSALRSLSYLEDRFTVKQMQADEEARRQAEAAAAADRAKDLAEKQNRMNEEFAGSVVKYMAEHPDVEVASGTAKITGQAFLKTRGGDVRVGAGNRVALVPQGTWVDTAFTLLESGGSLEKLPPAARDFYQRSIRYVQADAQGNFEFEEIPEGKFKLHTSITWEVPGLHGTTTTGGEVWVYVDAVPGKTTKVMLTR